MKLPTKKLLYSHGQCASYAPRLHPNPRLYKSEWLIFTAESELEEAAFLDRAPRLCTAHCVSEKERLEAAGLPYILYGWRRPRRFEGMPFDPEHPKWRDARWAPAFEDDPDPEWRGHR